MNIVKVFAERQKPALAQLRHIGMVTMQGKPGSHYTRYQLAMG